MVSWGLKIRGADETHIDAGVKDDEQARRSFVISAIKRMLANGDYNGRNVVSCLPSGKLRITSLRLAEAERYDIEQALRREVTQRFGLDPDEDAMDYVVAGSVLQGDEVKNELILFATDNETIKSHIEMLEETELMPVAIDTIPCALFRSFERSLRRQEDRERTSVFVDVGSSLTTVVFGRGGEISFVKQISIGGQNFTQEIATKLGVNISEAEMLRESLRADPDLFSEKSDLAEQTPAKNRHHVDPSTWQVMVDAVNAVAEDLAKEVSLCLRYYTVTFRGRRVERAVFAGGGAYEDILLNVLKRRLAVEIEVAQPLRGFDLSDARTNVPFNSSRRGLFCEWAVAVGLSLKGWDKIKTGKSQVTCELRESYERY